MQPTSQASQRANGTRRRIHSLVALLLLILISWISQRGESLMNLGKDRQTATSRATLPDGTSGKIVLDQFSCAQDPDVGFVNIDFLATWTNETRAKSHSTLVHVGETEAKGIRLDLGQSTTSGDLSYYLVVGSPDETSGYRVEEFPLTKLDNQNVQVSLLVTRQAYRLQLRTNSGKMFQSQGESATIDCRAIYVGDGPPGLVPGFTDVALYPSETFNTNLVVEQGKFEPTSRIGLPDSLFVISQWLFRAALVALVLLLISFALRDRQLLLSRLQSLRNIDPKAGSFVVLLISLVVAFRAETLRTFFVWSELAVIGQCVLLLVVLLPIGFVAMKCVRIDHPDWDFRIFVWFAAGTGVVTIVWTWIYMLGGAWPMARATLVILAIVSSTSILILSWRRRVVAGTALQIVPIRKLFQLVPYLILVGVVILFYLLPRVVSGEVSQRQLVGPDSVGYTNAVSALLSRGSFSDLEDAAIAAAEVQNTTELFRNDQVYQIADKGLSVSTEFIVGAYRIGFPSLAATVTGFLGPQHLLSAMYTTVALYISLGVILMFWLIKSTGLSPGIALLASIISVININLLVGFHEGGVVQGFVYPSLGAFLAASLANGLDGRYRTFLYGFSMMSAISSYIDLFFVYLAVLILWHGFAAIRGDSSSMKRLQEARRGTTWALVLMFPLSLRLPSFALRRLADARQGGWGWDSWTELGGLLGLNNPYSSSPDSLVVQMCLIAVGVMVYVAWHQTRQVSSARTAHSFALGFFAVGFGFYLYSRYLMGHSTYQWFKLAGTVIGPASPIVIIFAISSFVVVRRSRTRVMQVVMTATGIIAAMTSMSYLTVYSEKSQHLNPDFVDDILSTESVSLVEEFALVGAFDWEQLALTPFWTAEFLNPYRNDPRVNPIVRKDRPVALILRNDRCKESNCRKVPENLRFKIGGNFTAINLGINSAELRGHGQGVRLGKVNAALQRLGMPELESSWISFRAVNPGEGDHSP